MLSFIHTQKYVYCFQTLHWHRYLLSLCQPKSLVSSQILTITKLYNTMLQLHDSCPLARSLIPSLDRTSGYILKSEIYKMADFLPDIDQSETVLMEVLRKLQSLRLITAAKLQRTFSQIDTLHTG